MQRPKAVDFHHSGGPPTASTFAHQNDVICHRIQWQTTSISII